MARIQDEPKQVRGEVARVLPQSDLDRLSCQGRALQYSATKDCVNIWPQLVGDDFRFKIPRPLTQVCPGFYSLAGLFVALTEAVLPQTEEDELLDARES